MLTTEELRKLRDEKVFAELRKRPKRKKERRDGLRKPPQGPRGMYAVDLPEKK